MNYLDFFQLQEDPFGLTPDTAFFFPSKIHNDVLASLNYAVEQKEGFSLITGEPGTGKTTILKMFTTQWQEKAEIALIMTPRLSPEELVLAILEDLKIEVKTANKNEMIKIFADFLIAQSASGRRVIIVVDEAQNMSDTALEELRLLSNLETEKEKLLQIIMVGQPELERRLSSDNLRQLNQRITIRAQLTPLTAEETSDYISYRLIKAGKGSATFDGKVKNIIYRLSGGIPRLINLLTSRAMMAAYIGAAHHIEKKHAADAARHLAVSARRTPFRHQWLGYAAALALIAAVFISVSAILFQRPPQAPQVQAVSLRQAVVTARTANLREGPSMSAPVFMVVNKGKILNVTGEWTAPDGKRWFKVKISDGRERWVAAHIVSLVQISQTH